MRDEVQANVQKGYQDRDQVQGSGLGCITAKVTSPVFDDNLDNLFTYHPPTTRQENSYRAIRNAAKTLAAVILAVVPENADRSAAIRKVREAVMTANAGIALDHRSMY